MNKKNIVLALLFIVFSFGYSQDKTSGIFYKISLATTLKLNEDFDSNTEDDEPFFNPSALFFNSTFGYQIDERTTLGVNTEYNYHSKQGLHFFPIYGSMRYNVITNDDNYFIRGGYGRLVQLGNTFEKGTLYKVGIGIQTFDDDYKNSCLIGLDFSRKRFGFRQTEKISSLAIFIEYVFF